MQNGSKKGSKNGGSPRKFVYSGAGSCAAPAEDGEGEAGPFQREMINYMPARHRQMVLDYAAKIEADGSVRTYVEGGGKARKKAPPLVRDAYHKCIHALRQFRAFHLGAPAPPLSPHARCCGLCRCGWVAGVATDYLIKTKKGTGASDFRGMLKEAVDDTRNCLGEEE